MVFFGSAGSSSESFFRNPIGLDYDYQPKLVKYRENEMRQADSEEYENSEDLSRR